MKYLKITILEPAGGSMIYPNGYQSEIGDYNVHPLYYDENKLDNQSELLLMIKDKDFKPEMIRDRVVEITETEAKAISEANENRVEEIKDEAKVRRLEIKAQLGMALTTEEINALDPTKPNSAFGTSKIFADKVDELKSQELIAKNKGKDKPIA